MLLIIPIARERSTAQRRAPESHLFCLNRTDWIGQTRVPPTNTQGGVERKQHAAPKCSCQTAVAQDSHLNVENYTNCGYFEDIGDGYI